MTKYYVGTSGYSYSHWQDRFYPPDTGRRDWFKYYSKHFDTVEVNYTFYRWPDKDILEKWRKRAPTGFKYTLKAPQTITHRKKLLDASDYVEDFYKLTGILEDRMGCHLFQLPPNFHNKPENYERVRVLAEVLDGRKDNAIEFRHESWWSRRVYDLLRENNISFCIVDGLDMPVDIVETDDVAYIRFHGGHYDRKYSIPDLEHYAGEIKSLRADKVYAYFNNDKNAYAVENARTLREMIDDG